MADKIKNRIATAESELRTLAAVANVDPDAEYTATVGWVSESLSVTECAGVRIERGGDWPTVRFGQLACGVWVWTRPAHVETLLLRLAEHEAGGPALAEVFEAMTKEQG